MASANETEIRIPCIVIIRLNNLVGYKGPYLDREIENKESKFRVENGDLIVSKIREGIGDLKTGQFNSCITRQFSKDPRDRGFLFDKTLEDNLLQTTYECYEAGISSIRIVPAKIYSQIIERD